MFVLGAVLIGKRSELIKFYELGQGVRYGEQTEASRQRRGAEGRRGEGFPKMMKAVSLTQVCFGNRRLLTSTCHCTFHKM